MKLLKRLFSRNRWKVARTIWPYKDGWGTYNPSTRTILDTCLTKEEAQRSCDELKAHADHDFEKLDALHDLTPPPPARQETK